MKINKTIKTIISAIFWLLVWELLSLLVKDSLGQMLPGPIKVIKSWIVISSNIDFWKSCLITMLRVAAGLSLGIVVGFIFGVLSHCFDIFKSLISPIMKIVRAVPVISFIFLAFIFFSSGQLPIYISYLMVCPIIWQCVTDGLDNYDKSLVEMARVYHQNNRQILTRIKIPGIYKSLISTIANACGLAWKAELAAEAICTPALSIGKMMYRSKIQFDFEGIYSLTLTVVIISVIFEIVLKNILKKVASKEVTL